MGEPSLHGQPVGAIEIKEHDLAPVAEKDLEVREAIEHAGEREPQKLHAGLVVPADAEGGKRVVDGVVKPRV